MKYFHQYFESPLGLLAIAADEHAIVAVSFEEAKAQAALPSTITQECCRQLKDYFDLREKVFSIPINPKGTSFQLTVWNELCRIPYGKTFSYLDLARRLGDEKKIRAAGTANGKNPIAIIIPCHRVIGSDGTLVGYGGGLWRKKWLLEFEGGSAQAELFKAP